MRTAVAIAILLAVVATALVGVHEHAEALRLEYRVWEAMRRRDRLDKQIRELEAQLARALSPRRLLEGWDARRGVGPLADGGAE